MLRALCPGLSLLAICCGDVASELITRSPGSGGNDHGAATGGAFSSSGGNRTSSAGSSQDSSGGQDSHAGEGSVDSGGNSPGGGVAGEGGHAGACENSDDCSGERGICHPDTQLCVECVEDGHCSEEHETCSQHLGDCAVACGSDADCTDDDDRICDLDLDGGICVECRVDEDCEPGHLCRASECGD